MKWSETYIPTLRDDPAEAEIVSHKLLVRAGYIRKLAAGVYNYLPLMQRVLLKITQIVREEMNAAGAQEILMPVLHPAELWIQTGRWHTVGKELMRSKDRHERDLVLGGTHEEVVTFLVKGELRSYRQLPLNLYQIQNKFRDEIRPRFGLMRGREFIMKDAYSFDRDEEGLKISYQKMLEAYFKIFLRCGLDTRMVESDTGAMGGKAAHEFMVVVDTEGGENIIFYCDSCDYAANMEKASSMEAEAPAEENKEKRLEKVSTPNVKTVEEVTAYLKVPARRLVKTLLYKADDKIVAAMIRGDRQINEVKLKNALGCINLEMADAATVEKITGAPVGFAGPVELTHVIILADEEVTRLKNFVAGANENDFHYTGVNINRDFKIDQVAQIRCAQEGEVCPRCLKGKLLTSRGIEVGNTFMLGTKYSVALGANYLDADGQEKPFIMGSYGIGITRTAQAAVEKFHDQAGIIWPASIAPFSVEILPLNVTDKNQNQIALDIYGKMEENSLEVLIDDREDRAGVKFNDADLIGVPLRVNVGAKSLKEGKVEICIRKTKEVISVTPDQVIGKCKELLDKL
ncbi:MAG: proline--tRNA ligase [Candidatus Zixiibacteriota bacterium]